MNRHAWGWTGVMVASLLGWLLAPHTPDNQPEEVEIAPHMGHLQRFSQKLGYALAARNDRLSAFYWEELEEVFAELGEVESHDGFPIAETTVKIMNPRMRALKTALDKQDWAQLPTMYTALIEGCNDCHAATEHEFIQILPASGDPPFNQKF